MTMAPVSVREKVILGEDERIERRESEMDTSAVEAAGRSDVRSRGVKVRCACPPARLMPPACRMRGYEAYEHSYTISSGRSSEERVRGVRVCVAVAVDGVAGTEGLRRIR